MSNPDRIYQGSNATLYFKHLNDAELVCMIEAIEKELELRSQENIGVDES